MPRFDAKALPPSFIAVFGASIPSGLTVYTVSLYTGLAPVVKSMSGGPNTIMALVVEPHGTAIAAGAVSCGASVISLLKHPAVPTADFVFYTRPLNPNHKNGHWVAGVNIIINYRYPNRILIWMDEPSIRKHFPGTQSTSVSASVLILQVSPTYTRNCIHCP